MSSRVGCPNDECGAKFDVPNERLGRSMYCPTCGVRMTCRPLAVEAQLREQQQRIRGGDGVSIERLPFTVVVDVAHRYGRQRQRITEVLHRVAIRVDNRADGASG